MMQNYNIVMFQEQSQNQLNKAIIDFNLQVRNDPTDRQQLKYLLFEILGYPNMDKALQHHNANRLGTNDLLTKQIQIQNKVREKDITQFQICDCCGLLLHNEQLPYSTHLNEINLGIGVYLFFKDFLYYAFIFAIIFFIYSIYALATNSIAFNSDQLTKATLLCNNSSGCGFSEISTGAKVLNRTPTKNTMSQIQAWIGVAIVIIWGILQIIKTHLEQKLIVQVEATRISASDFTLMIKNFPKIHLGQTQQQSIKLVQSIFNQYYESQKIKRECAYPYQIVSVNIARSLYLQNRRNTQLKQQIAAQLHEHQNVFRNWILHRKNSNNFPIQYSARNIKYEQYQKFYSQIFQKQLNPKVPLQQKNTIFVTMRYSKAREQIQRNNAPISILGLCRFFKQSQFPIQGVKIKKAPEPQEIMWHNIGFPSSDKIIRRILTYLATMGLIGVSLALSIGISYIRQKTTSVSIGISIVVTLVNLGIQTALMYFSYFQHQSIESWQQSSIAIKIGIAQLVNSIGVPIVVTAISQSQQITKPWLKANGLADDVFFIALLNLIVPFTTLFDFYQHWLRLIRWWKSKPTNRLHLFGQKQLNKYYGNYKFDIGYQYAFLIKTCIFTAFFLSVQPIIALFAPFALLGYYFADKRNLFYHFHRPRYHFVTTNKTVDVMLMFSLLAFGLGSLFVNNANPEVSYEPPNNTLMINVIIIILSVVFLIIVPFRIFYCCIQKPELENKDYLKKKMLIYTDYDRTNPITKNSAISQFQDYIRSLQKTQKLPDQAQLVKLHVSTIQRKQTVKPENNLGKSYARMSLMRQQSINEPQYNYDLQFYQQIAHQNSINMGRPPSMVQFDNKQQQSFSKINKYLPKIKQSKQSKQSRGQ